MEEIRLTVIQKIEEFLPLKSAWEHLYRIDPEAQVFMSWQWMVNILENTDHKWFVICLYTTKPEKTYLAFFPMVRRNSRRGLFRILNTAGSPYADHTGILCHPQVEEEVICTLTEFLKKWPYWDQICGCDILDTRLVRILTDITKGDQEKKYRLTRDEPTICPFIRLPSSWEEYETNFLNSNSKYLSLEM